MITDLEFQNRHDALRLAPWLDMPLLRKELRESFAAELDKGDCGYMCHYLSGYKEDVRKFCDEEMGRVPRCHRSIGFVHRLILDLFPEANNDVDVANSLGLICSHVMRLDNWTEYNRDYPNVTPPPNPLHPTLTPPRNEVDDYDDYDDYEEEGDEDHDDEEF